MRNQFIYIMIMLPLIAWGQEERKHIRNGYKAYMNKNYNEAEVNFRKAEEENSDSYIARYNTSTALYQQQKLEESGKRFSQLLQETNDPDQQARVLHNIGNVMVQRQQYQQAVDAYKRSLKLNPGDDETRYNLAYALEKLREQQQQQNQDQQNKDQQQNQDQQNKDQQQDQEQDQQDQQNQEQQQEEKNEQQQQQQQEQQEQEEEQDQNQQQQPQQMSQEEAERLLNAILQKEKDVKEEVDKKKAKAAKIKTDKDW